MKLRFLKEEVEYKCSESLIFEPEQLIFKFKYIEIILIQDLHQDHLFIRHKDETFNYLIEETYNVENRDRTSIEYKKELQDKIDNKSSDILTKLIKDQRNKVKNKTYQLKLIQSEMNEVNRTYNEVAEYYAKEIMFI